MFIPLHDDTPLRMIRFQWVTGAIIVLNTLLFLITYVGATEESMYALAAAYGVIPRRRHVSRSPSSPAPIGYRLPSPT